MSNMTYTGKKGKIWSVVIGIVLVLAAVICAVFGVNKYASMKDMNTLTVSMNRYVYNTKLSVVEAECEKAFSVDPAYKLMGDMSGDNCEIVYVFAADTDLSSVKETLKNALNEMTKSGAELEGAFLNVTANSESVSAATARHTALRAAIALAVFTVLAFAYASIRYRIGAGIVAAVATVLGAALPTALILLVRIPVTNSVVYIGMVGAVISAAFAMLTIAKSVSAESDSAEEAIEKSVPAKEMKAFGIFAIVALAIIAVASLLASRALSITVWFSIMAILAVLVVWFLNLIYIPALYVPFRKKALERANSKEYQGAKKTSTKVKKVYEKKVAPAEPAKTKEATEETPVESPVESPVEETPVEETPAEEAPVEEVSVADAEVPVENAEVEDAEAVEETSVEENTDAE